MSHTRPQRWILRLATCALAGASLWTSTARADEGMWTYDKVPTKLIQERYGFTPTKEWLDHLRLSSVNVYASASFVSPDGLILTNHHVALGSLQRLASAEHNYVRDGFYAKTQADELPIPGMTVRVLMSIEDVTARVEGAVKKGATTAQAGDQREAQIALIEAECLKATGLKGHVVKLYGGAEYDLYRYKEYTDVRLVFAPELQAAFFGGDYDNFTYPRYDLDMAFLRAYENGKPAQVQAYLKVNPQGARDGDLVFVSGHPGRTDRLHTLAMLEYDRDVVFPSTLDTLKKTRDLLNAYSKRGPEQARRARTYLYFLENSIKSREGEYGGLQDPKLMAKKAAQENALRAAVAKDPKLAGYAKAWTDLEQSTAWAKAHEKERLFILNFGGRNVLGQALRLVRYPVEIAKPDAERLEGYHDAELPETLRGLQAHSPYYRDLDEVTLTFEFERIAAGLGPDHPFTKALLQGATPQEAVKKLLDGTKINDAAFRGDLLKDKGKAIAASTDPMLELARRVDPMVREVRKAFRDNVESVEDVSLAAVAQAEFAAYGSDTYPDATGTLRLAFGKIAGYPFATTLVPPFTTFYGLYDRAYSFGNTGDFRLTPKEEAAKGDVDMGVFLNNVSTCDITGGNSGSPLVDKEGRLVGLVFDGNMESHPNTFVYDETEARCVAVDVRGLLHALSKVYGAQGLVDEMLAAAK